MSSKVVGRKRTAQTALERQQKSREQSQNAYSRARNAAEREVVHIMVARFGSVYDELRNAVESEIADTHRAVRQARIRSACAAWYRAMQQAEWDVLLDRCIAEVTAGTTVVIRRRRGAGSSGSPVA